MISVIIPAYNAAATLDRCLQALLAQTAPRDSYEIIVVDDGSSDNTHAVAEARGVKVLSQPNRGAAAARNLGAERAGGDVLFFVDADSVPDAGWVQALCAPFADVTVAGASGVKKTLQKNIWARYTQLEYDFKYKRLSASAAMDFVDSSTAAYRRALFLESGGFDPAFLEAEDTELSFRLAEAGQRMVLVPDAVVYHTHPESLGEYLRRKFRYALWRARVYARYPRKAASDQRTPVTQKLQAILAFALIPVMLTVLVLPPMAVMALALLVLFLVTTLPFAAYCAKTSPAVAGIAPLAMLCSAYASALGVTAGLVHANHFKFSSGRVS